MEETRKSLDPRMLGEIIAKRKWHLLLPLVVAAGASVFLVERLPNVYRVESTILFEDRALLSREVEGHLLPGTRSDRGRREDRMDEANLLRMKVLAPNFLGALAEEMGFLEDPERLEAAREKKRTTGDPKSAEEIMRQDVTSWITHMLEINLSGPDVYQLTIEGRNRRLLYDLSNRINTKLIELVQTEQIGRLQAASEFTDEQIAVYKEKVDDAKRELQRFLDRQPVASGGGAPLRVDPGTASRLAEETEYEILRIRERLDETASTLAQSYGFDLDDFASRAAPATSLLEERLRSLERQLGYLLLERDWSDPTVIAHNKRIGETRAEIEEGLRRFARSSLADGSGRLQDLAAEGARDRSYIAALEVRRGTLSRQAVPTPSGTSPSTLARRDQELEFLEEQVRINEEIYRSFVRQATSTRISEAVESDQLSRTLQVIQPPQWPRNPVRPNKPQMYALAGVLGLALGVALLMVGEYIDTTVKDVHEAEELVGAPILGTIPLIEYEYREERKARSFRRGLLYTILGGIILGAIIGWFLYRGGADAAPDENGTGAVSATARPGDAG
ncbi:MAG: hypothetical protein ABIK65_15215 [Candidatus Eisenbacteria bacterium]